MDRDANIALFQEAAATTVAAADTAGGGGGSSASNGGGASSKGGVARFLLVATFEGREARAAVPMQRCACGILVLCLLLMMNHLLLFVRLLELAGARQQLLSTPRAPRLPAAGPRRRRWITSNTWCAAH